MKINIKTRQNLTFLMLKSYESYKTIITQYFNTQPKVYKDLNIMTNAQLYFKSWY